MLVAFPEAYKLSLKKHIKEKEDNWIRQGISNSLKVLHINGNKEKVVILCFTLQASVTQSMQSVRTVSLRALPEG